MTRSAAAQARGGAPHWNAAARKEVQHALLHRQGNPCTAGAPLHRHARHHAFHGAGLAAPS